MPVTMTPQMKTVKNPQAKATAPPRTPVLRGGNGSCRHTEISERRRARTRPNAATWKASVHVEPRTRAATNRTGETVASTTRAPLPWIEDAGTIHSSLNATRPHLPQIPCSSPAAYGVPLLSLQRLAINSLTHTTESHGSFLSFYCFHGHLHIFVEFQQRCCFAIKATAGFQSRTGFDTSGSFESDGRVLANLIEP